MKVTRAPLWKTGIKESVSGREVRNSYMAYPLWDFTLSYEFLRAASSFGELQSIVGFFNSRRGAWDDFLFLVPDDSVATLYQFGTGNGSQSNFQLLKSFGGFIEPVYDVKGTPQLYKNDVLLVVTADYTISATGMVSFTTPPTAGHTLKWSGEYYQRVRFKKDSIDFDRFLYQLWEAKKVELRSVKV